MSGIDRMWFHRFGKLVSGSVLAWIVKRYWRAAAKLGTMVLAITMSRRVLRPRVGTEVAFIAAARRRS
jgi:hypothetical protein